MPFGIDDAIMLGGAALSIGGSLFGRRQRSGNNQSDAMLAQLAMQENALRQKQMNLDATRRKRDIIRQAQVATANAENAAANSGAMKSSSIEGARASIAGQEGVNILGVEQNREIGNQMFNLENMRAFFMAMSAQNRNRGTNIFDMGSAISPLFSGNTAGSLGRLGSWGVGLFNR